MIRIGFWAAAVLSLLMLLSTSARAQAASCKLALVLALDVSSSVDDAEHHMQTLGLAAALADEDVQAAILYGGGIWMTVFEWSGINQQVIQVPWTHLNSQGAIAEVASTLLSTPRSYSEFPTALGYALGFARIQLDRAPVPCVRRVIDISGDGVNNDGFPPSSAYKAFNFTGVTVNGLVIRGADPDPEAFYRDNVVSGPGHFLQIAAGYPDYETAMRKKLIREILGGPVSLR